MIKFIDKYIKIDTDNTTLLIVEVNNVLYKIYYGNILKDDTDYIALFNYKKLDTYSSTDDISYHSTMISTTGDGNNIENMVRLIGNNNTFVSRFAFEQRTIVDINEPFNNFPHSLDKKQTLKLSYRDQISNVVLNQYISIFEGSDVICFQNEIENNTLNDIYINRLMSFQMDFECDQLEFHSFDGAWTRERNHTKRTVKSSIVKVESKSGFSSNLHNPFVILEIPHQGIIASNLIYSGNHSEIVEHLPMGRARFLTGINDYMLHYLVKPNEKFKTPEAIITFADSLDYVTRNMHEFSKKHVINRRFINENRPILLNNWEATYFDFTYEKLMKLANIASETGIELFVLDDGWFGERNIDDRSLGDWFDNVQKTGGLDNLSRDIRKLGMKFGLWVEPEMISENSDLYRAHPDYMMRLPNHRPIEQRHQQMLDLSRLEVQNYLIDVLSQLFDKVNPDYVKWDCNRNMIDIYSIESINHGEYFIKYMQGLYNVLFSLTSKYPNILFEGCSAGGNRFDLGMLYYFPQIWASDNSEASCRLLIQEGTLYGYPQSSIGSHVSIVPNHQTLFATSIESRFNVASVGAFGYELDLCQVEKSELDVIKKQIKFYKEKRPLLQRGNYYRLEALTENNSGGWIVVSDNQEEAIATIVVKNFKNNWIRPKFKFKGLNPNYRYSVSMRQQNNLDNIVAFESNGDVLMKYGIDFGDLFFTENDRSKYGNSFASRMILINKL